MGMNSIDGAITGRDIRTDDLATLDLNMLTALRALLQERSVTRAGSRLGLGQPATSAVLRRLRTHFGDQLLVRKGTSYDLSPLAATLLGTVEHAVAAAESVFLGQGFDPATTRRTFTVMAADAALVHIGEHLLPALADTPNVTLEVATLTDTAMENVDATLRAVDALTMPRGILAGFPAADLWTDEYVLAVGADSPLTTENLGPATLAEMSWVSSFRGRPPVIASLEAWGIRPRVQVVVPSYLALPMILARSTRHVALIQRRLARRLEPLGGVRFLPGPPLAPPIQVALWWHPSRDEDAGHVWFRRRVVEATAAMRVPD